MRVSEQNILLTKRLEQLFLENLNKYRENLVIYRM